VSLQRSIRGITLLGLAAAWLVVPAGASGHAAVQVGEFHLHVGWAGEPAYAGQPNAVEVFVADHDDQPVTDLSADALKVVVSTGGQDSPTLTLAPAFDLEEGFGTPGEYAADLMPTVPGEYTFHFTGSVHDQPVDASITSGEETFSSVVGSSDIEFPVKVPTLADVATRLDRIDGRITELQGAGTASANQVAAATAAAQSAAAAAEKAQLVGLLVGGAGLVVAVVALWYAMRSARRSGGTS
jgi:hypothetical protein